MSDFYHEELRKARKEHKCDLCRKPIEKGVHYVSGAGVFEGNFYKFKHHTHCGDLINEYLEDQNQDSYCQVDVIEWAQSRCNRCINKGYDNHCVLGFDPIDCGMFVEVSDECSG